jgi:hypothetical protein
MEVFMKIEVCRKKKKEKEIGFPHQTKRKKNTDDCELIN